MFHSSTLLMVGAGLVTVAVPVLVPELSARAVGIVKPKQKITIAIVAKSFLVCFMFLFFPPFAFAVLTSGCSSRSHHSMTIKLLIGEL
jgi:hypothetical protein